MRLRHEWGTRFVWLREFVIAILRDETAKDGESEQIVQLRTKCGAASFGYAQDRLSARLGSE